MVISCCLSPPLNFDDCLPTRPDLPLIDATNSPYVRLLKDVAAGQSEIGWKLFSASIKAVFRLLSLHTRDINQPVINRFVSYQFETVKAKQSHYTPRQALRFPGVWVSQISRQLAHKRGNVVSPTHRPPLSPGNIPGTHFCHRLSRPQGHSEAGRFMLMKNCSDTMGNRTRDLPACSAVPQPTAPPCVRNSAIYYSKKANVHSICYYQTPLCG